MSVKKISGSNRWLVHVEKAGFKRVRKSFDSRREAEQFERDYLCQPQLPASEVVDQPGDNRRLRELIELWYQYHGINLSDGGRRRIKLDALANELKNPVASSLSSEAVVAWRYAKLQSGMAKKTCNNLHGYLSALYSTLLKLKVIGYANPLAGIDFIKVHERQLSYLSHGQIDDLLLAISSGCVNKSTWYVTQLCLRTGARWGEAEQLRLKQLHDSRVTYEFTKSKKVRSIPLDPLFYHDLTTFTAARNPDDRVFSNCIGAFRRSVERAHLELPSGQCSHILRHSFASHFIINGGNILSLQRILGHADINMTMRYAHLAPDHLNDAIKLNPIA
jgi:integrase